MLQVLTVYLHQPKPPQATLACSSSFEADQLFEPIQNAAKEAYSVRGARQPGR
jgi:hypothetical protein